MLVRGSIYLITHPSDAITGETKEVKRHKAYLIAEGPKKTVSITEGRRRVETKRPQLGGEFSGVGDRIEQLRQPRPDGSQSSIRKQIGPNQDTRWSNEPNV